MKAKLSLALDKEAELAKLIQQKDREIQALNKTIEEQTVKNKADRDELSSRMQQGLEKLRSAFEKEREVMTRKLYDANFKVDRKLGMMLSLVIKNAHPKRTEI